MTDYSDRKVKCPACGSTHISKLFDIDKTYLFCQNGTPKYNDQGEIEFSCPSVCAWSWITYHHDDPRFGEIIGKGPWRPLSQPKPKNRVKKQQTLF